MEDIPVAQARFDDLLDRAVREHQRFRLTRDGHPQAVLLSVADWESLSSPYLPGAQKGSTSAVGSAEFARPAVAYRLAGAGLARHVGHERPRKKI